MQNSRIHMILVELLGDTELSASARRYVLMFFLLCSMFIVPTGAHAQPAKGSDVSDQTKALLSRGDCAGAWNLLWPRVRDRDATATAMLIDAMNTHGLKRPGLNQDAISWERDLLVLNLHYLPYLENLSATDVGAFFTTGIVRHTGQELEACIRDRRVAVAGCVSWAVENRWFPDFPTYAREVDAVAALPNALPASCSMHGIVPRHPNPSSSSDAVWMDRERLWKRAARHVALGNCAEAWDLLWPAAKASNDFRRILWEFMLPTISGLLPPGFGADMTLMLRHYSVLAAHGLTGSVVDKDRLTVAGEEAAKTYLRVHATTATSRRLGLHGGDALTHCLSSVTPAAKCVDIAVANGFVPSFDEYAREIDAVSRVQGSRGAICYEYKSTRRP